MVTSDSEWDITASCVCYKNTVQLTIICASRRVAVYISRAVIEKIGEVNEDVTWDLLRWTMAAEKDGVVHTGIYKSAMDADKAQQHSKQFNPHLENRA